MKQTSIVCVFLVILCITILTAGCTGTGTTPASGQSSAPASQGSASSPIAVTTTPACPDKLVWDGEWQSSMLGMAGNHDLSTAWTKYTDRPYGDTSMLTMKQTCWDVEGKLVITGIKCDATFKGTIDKNILSGTWSAPTFCGTKSETGRKFSLTMAADNKSWLGDFYSDGQDPSKFPPNWAGRRPVTK